MSEAIILNPNGDATGLAKTNPGLSEELRYLADAKNYSVSREKYLSVCNEREREAFLQKDPNTQLIALAEVIRKARVFQERISPPGAFNLPPLLDQRRLDYGIVDNCFTRHAAVYDSVLIWQIPQFESGRIGDGIIESPKNLHEREKLECGRGIIVSAGLKALDELRSHGMDLGHIVNVGKHAPRRIRVDIIGGEPQFLLKIHPGDIADSEDLAELLITGKARILAARDEHDAPYHRYQFRNPHTNEFDAKPLTPLLPWQSDDQ